jgi:2-dehydro-3-deoxyphosphogluconate aldolase/(4S)-4-hydroxy-2-oxoglutarate aldolase
LSRALPQALIGAGTVTDPETARLVIAAGAKFVVSPVFRPRLVEACHERDIAVMPGCFSPTEILAAWDLGADIVKIFPATSLGPGFIKDLRGPFPLIKVMPTGGVSRDNAADWIRAGAVAIGVGSAIVESKAIEKKNFAAITANAQAFVDAVRGAR